MLSDAYLSLKKSKTGCSQRFSEEKMQFVINSKPFMSHTNTMKFATCDLCDAHKNDATGSFRVLPPVFKNYGGQQKFCGAVVTIKCFEDNSLIKQAVDSAGQGRVLVVDGGASLRRAPGFTPH